MSLLPRPIKFKKGDGHSSEYFKRNVNTDTLFIWKGFMGCRMDMGRKSCLRLSSSQFNVVNVDDSLAPVQNLYGKKGLLLYFNRSTQW